MNLKNLIDRHVDWVLNRPFKILLTMFGGLFGGMFLCSYFYPEKPEDPTPYLVSQQGECKIYGFRKNRMEHYFTTCEGSVSRGFMNTEGKSQVLRYETIPTIVRKKNEEIADDREDPKSSGK